MPGVAGARAKRLRAQAPRRLKPSKILALALDMEEPLTDALAYVQALHLIGYGLWTDRDSNGRSIVTVARAASEQLESIREIWDRVIKSARGGNSS